VTRRATLIKQYRAKDANVLLLDAGNSLIGDQAPANTTQGKSSIEAMNLIGYDAMALALPDLSLGRDALQARIAEAGFPILSANVRLAGADQPLTQSYVLRQVGGQNIAIIGLTEAGQVDGFTIADPLATLKKVVPSAKKEAGIIIVLTHAPVSVARQWAAQVSDIDLIITGGDEYMPAGEMVGDTLIVHADVGMSGHAGRNMGVVAANFDAQGRLTGQTNSVIPISADLAEDAEMVEWVAKALAQ